MTKKIIPIFFQIPLYWIALVVFKIFLHFKVEGRENLKDIENDSIIFASNHNSYLDGVFAATSLPRGRLWPKNFFPIRFLAIDRFFQWNFFPINIIYRLGGAVKITRVKDKKPDNSHLHQVLAEPIKLLKQGEKIWIYPEGGFNNDGTPKKPRNGVTFLHQQTKTPIVPVAIIGNDKILSTDIFSLKNMADILKSLLMINKIKVVFGEPIYSVGGANIDESTNLIMNEIYKLKKQHETI